MICITNNGGNSHAKSEKQRIKEKLQKIDKKKQSGGSRKTKKLRKYSNNFNEMFTFFLKSYRSGLLTFCGVSVDVEFDINEVEGKHCFRNFDNGQYKTKPIISRHPNIVKGVIIGKKSWGLWLNQWTDGIVDWSFTKEEILGEFKDKGIKIPEPLLNDFNNRIEEKKLKRNIEYYNSIMGD
jgi:hypothetical protein